MPFTPVTWVDGTTALNKTNLDAMQAGIIAAERSENKAVANGYASLDAGGKVPVAQLPALPGFEVVSARIVTDIATSSTTQVDLLTFAGATFENAKYYLEIMIPLMRLSVAGSTYLWLAEGGASVTGTFQVDTPVAGQGVGAALRAAFTPSAGLHTYKVVWQVGGGTNTIKTTGLAPAEFRIVKA